jgi:molecular chaperone DnaK (HSP70)
MRRRSSAEQIQEPAAASPVHNISSKPLSCLSDGDGLLFDAWGIEEQQAAVADGFYVGIDLGTTNSAAALWHLSKNRVKVLKTEGYTTMPSFVYFEDQLGGTAVPSSLVGHAAVKRSAETGRRVISCAKRVIGLKYSDPTLESLSSDLPIKVVPDPQGSGGVAIELPASSDAATAGDASSKRTTVSPEQVSTLLIAALKARADAYISKGKLAGVTAVQGCVITVPVHFPEARRRATRSAARAAGFATVVTLGESTAAAMAYGLHVAGLSKVAVIFDLGGGTLDVTVLRIKEGGRFEVLSTAGKQRVTVTLYSLYLMHSAYIYSK